MARSEARVSVDIWGPESDFTTLSPGAQWMYFLLLSQPDLAHTGVLALREARWSRRAAGVTVETITNNLAELEAARYVVIDRDVEELLIRSLIRRDKVYRQPQVLRNAADQLPLVTSPALRLALAVELRRVADLPMPEASTRIVAEMVAALPNPAEHPTHDPADQAARTTPGERGVVTAVRKDSPYPVPRTDPPPAAALALRPDETLTQRSKRITDAYAAIEPMCRWPAVNGVVLKAIRSQRYADAEIEAALLRLATEGRSVTVETLRVELNGMPARASPRPSTTDRAVGDALVIAQRLAEEEARHEAK